MHLSKKITYCAFLHIIILVNFSLPYIVLNPICFRLKRSQDFIHYSSLIILTISKYFKM